MIAAATEGRGCPPAATEGQACPPAATEGRGSLTKGGFTTFDPAQGGRNSFGHLTDRGFTTVDPAQGCRILFSHSATRPRTGQSHLFSKFIPELKPARAVAHRSYPEELGSKDTHHQM